METVAVPAPASPVDESALIAFRVPQIRTGDDFYDFCQENLAYKFERDSDGLITIMPNTGGKREYKIQN